MANRFKDFDAVWAESKKAPLTVKVRGKVYELPASLPAKVVILLARERLANQEKDPNAEVPLDKVVELLEPFFGGQTLQEWVEPGENNEPGLDVDQLGDIFKWSMSVYSGEDPDAESADEASTDPNS